MTARPDEHEEKATSLHRYGGRDLAYVLQDRETGIARVVSYDAYRMLDTAQRDDLDARLTRALGRIVERHRDALRQAAAEERARIVAYLRSEPEIADSLHGVVMAGRLADAIERLAHHATSVTEPTNTIVPLPPHVEAAVVEIERRMAAEPQPKSEIRAVATLDEWGKPSVSATPIEYRNDDGVRVPLGDAPPLVSEKVATPEGK